MRKRKVNAETFPTIILIRQTTFLPQDLPRRVIGCRAVHRIIQAGSKMKSAGLQGRNVKFGVRGRGK